MWIPFLLAALTFAIGAEMAQDPFVEWLSRAGSLGIMAAAVVAFLRGWIVTGKAYEQALAENARLREERNRAVDLVYRHAELAERALAAAEKR